MYTTAASIIFTSDDALQRSTNPGVRIIQISIHQLYISLSSKKTYFRTRNFVKIIILFLTKKKSAEFSQFNNKLW
jgi:hypothetical protein